MKTNLKVLAVCLAMVFEGAVQAASVSHDTYLADTFTEYQWLDTVGTLNSSYNEQLALIGTDEFTGYTFTTRTKLDSLIWGTTGVTIAVHLSGWQSFVVLSSYSKMLTQLIGLHAFVYQGFKEDTASNEAQENTDAERSLSYINQGARTIEPDTSPKVLRGLAVNPNVATILIPCVLLMLLPTVLGLFGYNSCRKKNKRHRRWQIS